MEGRDLAGSYGRGGQALPGRPSAGPAGAHGGAQRRMPGQVPQVEIEVDLPNLAPPVAAESELEESGAAGAVIPSGAAVPGADPAALDPRLWAGIPASLSSLPPYAVTPRELTPYSAPEGWGQASVAGSQIPEPMSPSPPVMSTGAGDMIGDGDALDGGRRGLSFAAVFGTALLAHVALAVFVAGVIWAFPKECGGLIRRVVGRMDVSGAGMLSAAARSPREGPVDRLTILALEDRALYRGDRSALEQLQRMARELDSADSGFDAVQASLVRVRQSFQLSQAEVPGPLDPREILPGAESERDLPATAIVDVLRNRHQPPAARQRAAYLLKNERQSAAAQSALFHAIQDDPNLVVVRQAFQSFQELTGYPGRDFFDADAIDRWWARNSASFIGQRSDKP